MEFLKGLGLEIWGLFIAMAPYLLLGFFVAGILYVFIPRGRFYGHFSKNNLSSVVKSSLFGIPLPLCSCGVIPVAAHLDKEGASKGAIASFLVSTPSTGVDSILATYSLLGPIFAIVRPVASFFGGILSGVLVNISGKKSENSPSKKFMCSICEIESPHAHNLSEKIITIFKYGFMELVEDVGKWLIIGVVLGGIIGYFISPDIISKYLGNPKVSYPVMLLIGIPMYVCATGSIPIAASLIMKGMSPGAGLVFLFTGPATNAATISFVAGKMGKKVLFIYLFSIIVIALLFGLLIDYVWKFLGSDIGFITGRIGMLPGWIKTLSGIILAGLILKAMFNKKEEKIKGSGKIFRVSDMTCQHCVETLKSALNKLSGVKSVRINLKKKEIEVEGDVSDLEIISSIKKAGYSVSKGGDNET